MSYPLSATKRRNDEPLLLPASRLLRPFDNKLKFSNSLRLRRILNEMTYAAEKRECYHLWWHPENFGDYPEQSMDELKQIIETYKRLRNKYGMESWNMGEYFEKMI
jgi:hypothetical protein